MSTARDNARVRILVTNDDGFGTPGIEALAEALRTIGAVTVVAPDREHSGASHALTIMRPLRVRELARCRYSIDGTPTDAVHVGVATLTGDSRPDLVVSGINRGYNLGDDVTYSGTVAGALEGALLGIPAIAVSAPDTAEHDDLRRAAEWTSRLAAELLERRLPGGVFLNVNVPVGSIAGARVTRQGMRSYRASVVRRDDPKGRPYYWIAASDAEPAHAPEDDHTAVRDGYVSVTPLRADLTHEPTLGTLASWSVMAAREEHA